MSWRIEIKAPQGGPTYVHSCDELATPSAALEWALDGFDFSGADSVTIRIEREDEPYDCGKPACCGRCPAPRDEAAGVRIEGETATDREGWQVSHRTMPTRPALGPLIYGYR